MTEPAQGLKKAGCRGGVGLLLTMFAPGGVFRPYIRGINGLVRASSCFLLLLLLLALHQHHAPQLCPLLLLDLFLANPAAAAPLPPLPQLSGRPVERESGTPRISFHEWTSGQRYGAAVSILHALPCLCGFLRHPSCRLA